MALLCAHPIRVGAVCRPIRIIPAADDAI
jgi:hypothetical protein